MGVLWRKHWACAVHKGCYEVLWFPKAINTIPQQRLLQKLSCHEIRKQVSTWINNLLKDNKKSTEFFRWRLRGYVCIFRLFGQYQRNSQMTKLVGTNRYYRVVKVKASCAALVTESPMKFSMDKHKPCIWKHAKLGWALHCLLALKTDILALW